MDAFDKELASWCYALAVSTSLGVLCLSGKERLCLRSILGTLLLYGGTAAGVGVIIDEWLHHEQVGYSIGAAILVGSRIISFNNLRVVATRIMGGSKNA